MSIKVKKNIPKYTGRVYVSKYKRARKIALCFICTTKDDKTIFAKDQAHYT